MGKFLLRHPIKHALTLGRVVVARIHLGEQSSRRRFIYIAILHEIVQ